MLITNAHLNWFKLKCLYPVNSKAYAIAKARPNNASYSDLEKGQHCAASLWENGCCESFNARFRDEFLNGEIFYSLGEAQILFDQWLGAVPLCQKAS